jgi:hypothetical protein
MSDEPVTRVCYTWDVRPGMTADDERPFLCPVCRGSGLVPPGFYDLASTAGYSTTTVPMRETCRACDGQGVVWRAG